MPTPDELPTAYAEFFTRAFAKRDNVLISPTFLFESAEAVESIDECIECGKPIINITAFGEGIGEHYVLTDEQIERLEEALEDSGVEVSDDDVCSDHV